MLTTKGTSLYLSSLSNYRPVSFVAQLCALVPVTLVNAIIGYWVFTGLWATRLEMLRDKQLIKAKLITRLGLVLLVVVGLSALVMLIEGAIKYSFSRDDYWANQWTFVVVWDMIFAGLMAAVGAIFVPTSKSHLIAYGEELAEERANEHHAREQIESPSNAKS